MGTKFVCSLAERTVVDMGSNPIPEDTPLVSLVAKTIADLGSNPSKQKSFMEGKPDRRAGTAWKATCATSV